MHAGSPTAPAEGGSEQHGLRTALALVSVLDRRQPGFSDHAHGVGHYAALIAAAGGMAPRGCERVRLAGVLHDIGKVGVDNSVLTKPGLLDEIEWADVRCHPGLGAKLLRSAGLEDIARWVVAHHERPDGLGYPHGLTGERIPYEALILGIADAYEAMLTERPYRRALEPDEAAEELRRGAGAQFDAGLVEVFLRALGAAEAETSADATRLLA